MTDLSRSAPVSQTTETREPTDAERIEQMAAIIRNGGTLVIAPDCRAFCEAAGIEIDGKAVVVSDFVPPGTLVALDVDARSRPTHESWCAKWLAWDVPGSCTCARVVPTDGRRDT